MRERELLADPLNGLIETETCFDADDEQVEDVGETEPDAMLALLGQSAEHHARQHVAEAAARQRHRHVRSKQHRRGQHGEHQQGEPEPDAEENHQRFTIPVPGVHEPQLKLRHFGQRPRRHAADALEAGHDRPLVARRGLENLGWRSRQFAEALFDRRRPAGGKCVRGAHDDERRE